MPRVRRPARTKAARHWKIGVYIRLSREDKEKDEPARRERRNPAQRAASGSVVEQKKILVEWIEDYFSEENHAIVGYFTDDGLSGTDDTRDDFQRMMEFAQDGRINCIVVKTLSRAFRNYADQGRYLEQIFPRLGVRFISSGNPFVDSHQDPDAITGGLEIPINGLMNDRFAAKTSTDIRRTLDAKRRRGEFIGAFAPYGYRKDPEDKNRLLVDEVAAGHIRDIFRWFALDGISKRGIAIKLNQLGIPNPTAYKQRVLGLKYQNPAARGNDGLWSASNVAGILKNEVYIGSMVQGRHRIISYKVHAQVKMPEDEWYVVPNTHQAVVSEALFRQAGKLHLRDTRTAPVKTKNYLFSGLLRCADCKKAMRRRTSKQLVYYHCRTVADKGACSKRSIREDKITAAVLDAIRLQIDLVQSLDDALDAIRARPIVNAQSGRLRAMLQSRQRELDRIIKAMSSLYVDWKSGEITREDHRNIKAEFDEQCAALRAAIGHIQREMNALAKEESAEDPYLTAFLEHKNIKELSRGMVVALIDAIYIGADGQITIDFAFADQFKRAADAIENSHDILAPAEKGAVS